MAGVVHCHHHFARRGYRQRVYVERTKPLEQYTTEKLYVRFRFGKADIEYLVNLLRPKLQHRTQRSHGLSVEDQILIALRFYACGTFYQVVGDYMGVVKSAVCDVVRDVSIALASQSTPRSASPPATSLLDVICPAPSPGNPCDVEPQVSLPPAARRPEVPVALPPAADLVAPSRPFDLPAPSRLRPSTVPPETLRLTAPPPSSPQPSGSPAPPPPVVAQNIAAVSQANDVTGVRQLSICAPESTCRVSIGRPPDAVSLLYSIWTPSSIYSAMDCRIWGALGLCQRSSTYAARGSSSSLHHSVIVTPSTSRANVTFTVSSWLSLTVTCSFVLCSRHSLLTMDSDYTHSCLSLVLCI
ncbi:putative nuclease HARBI1 [Anabarilius grahami]|uniref:Putative nuclease HARBI1 n=1 Tax=Anabarilius grahami TaxID=495550 RepID=A0A3N0YMF7_ANAGA|nr:putative nuclease HARBI1 [Anabarilius grahami]